MRSASARARPPWPLVSALPGPLPRRPRAGRFDAIVVGSGVGGCAAAALLGAAGLRVLVVEKNDRPGGVLAAYERHGFKFDVGSHLVAQGARGPLGALLREVGVAPPRLLTHRTPVRARGIFGATAPPDRAGLPGVALQVSRALGLDGRERLRVARMLFQVGTLTEWELRRWDRRTLDEFIRGHTDHPGAYYLFSFLASIFYVLPPWSVSAGEAIRGLRSVLASYSLSYVEGGMDRVAASLLGRVLAAGGEVVVGQRVRRIEPRPGGLRVSCEGGDAFDAPLVACNLAPVDLVGLVGAEALPPAWTARARSIKPSGNAHQVKLALARPIVDEGCVIGGLSIRGLRPADLTLDLLRTTVDDIAAGRVTDPLALYAPVPTNFDPTLAPPGRQIIVASVYGPTTDTPVDPPERWQERILASLARALPGLGDALLFHEFAPVPSLGAWMGKSANAAICNGQWPGQVGADRLPVATPVPGLFLVGDGAGGRGIGVELATRSAREAAAQMLAMHARSAPRPRAAA